MKRISVRSFRVGIILAVASLLGESQAWCAAAAATVYVQTNLVSDIPGLAQSTDPNLKNPWGVSYSATSPFWVSDAATNLSTLYQGTGSTINARVVSVPGGPTGEIQNSTTDFVEANGKTASFIFSSLNGTIWAWNSTDNTVASLAATVKGASFTGLALGNNGAGNFLYAANSAGLGSIEVFDKSFTVVTASFPFSDPNVPKTTVFGPGYVPYNIQNINNQLYVEYANLRTGAGAVSIFDLNGNFIKDLVAPGTPQLNMPWGVAIAPAGFGTYANNLLVGNFGNGQINAFDATTGVYQGTLQGFNGPIANSGLWALSVRTGGTFNTTGVYITAGLNNQADGLLALLTPATAATVGISTASQLPAGKIGAAYLQTLTATGGTPAYSNWTVSSGTLPPGLTLNSKTGVLSGTPAALSGTFSFMISVSDSTGAAGTASFQLAISQPTTSTAMARIGSFAQVASGAGWKSTITLINLSASTVNAQINFYADNGSPLALPLAFPEFSSTASASSQAVTVGPNDSVVISSTSSAAAIGMGWADVFASGPLAGYLTFSFTAGGATSEGTVPLDSRLSSSVLLPYDNTNGYLTGVALANQSSTAQIVMVTLLDQNGSQLTSTPVNLPAFGHSSFFVSSQFAASANQLGIIQFQGTADVTGVGLRFSPLGTFTSIPIIR